MGSLLGHLIPGIAFIFCGLVIFFKELPKLNKIPYAKLESSGAAPNMKRCCHRLLEGSTDFNLTPWGIFSLALCILCGGLVFFELRENSSVHINNMQHATMYTMFGLALFVDFGERFSLFIPRSTAVMLLVANCVQLFLFFGHVPDTNVEQRLHNFITTSLLFLIILNVIVIKWCTTKTKMGMAFVACIEGSAMAFTGIKLHTLAVPGKSTWGPPKEDDGAHLAMQVQVEFAWICIGIFLFFFTLLNALQVKIRTRKLNSAVLDSSESQAVLSFDDPLYFKSSLDV